MAERDESLDDALHGALGDANVADADVYVRRARRGFARYALNALGQHAELREDTAVARAAVPAAGGGHRVASAATTDVSRAGLTEALRRARALAEIAPAAPDWPGFTPRDDTHAAAFPTRYSATTAGCTAEERARRLAPALAAARGAGLTAAGVFETSRYEVAIANTTGLARSAAATLATFKMFALDAAGVSGFAQATHRDVDSIEVEACAAEARAKALAGADPVALPAGEYDVVLEAPAVTELLEWLSFTTFGAHEVEQGASALAGRVGTRMTGPSVTLVDDATDDTALGFGLPFDRDGTLRQRVVLIDGGTARGYVSDRAHAARMGVAATGHAAPLGGMSDAPRAQSIQMAGGTDTLASLVARISRGIHITRLHYVNGYLDPRRTLTTGLTRDGTFLIEGGQRTRGVRNMRFTDSVLEAFSRIDGLTAKRDAVPAWWTEAGAFVAPAVLLRGLRFTAGG